MIRNLSFFTGVLNLGVWFAYARSRIRDTRRLIIAAGLGLQMTGEAIGHAIRQLDFSIQISLGSQHFHRTHAFSLPLSMVARFEHGN